MKKTFFLLSLLAVLFTACKDDEDKKDSHSVNPYFEHFTFLQFNQDVIKSGNGFMGFFLSGFEYDSSVWNFSAYNKDTKKTHILHIADYHIHTSEYLSPVTYMLISTGNLTAGYHNLIITHKPTGKSFKENFLVCVGSQTGDIYIDRESSNPKVGYNYLNNYMNLYFFFQGDEMPLRSTFQNYNDFQALSFQNKSTGKVYMSKRYTDNYGFSRLDIPSNMPEGYYYIGGDRYFTERAYLICRKTYPKIKDIKIVDGKLKITGSHFFFEPSSKLLPHPYFLDRICSINFMSKGGFILSTVKVGEYMSESEVNAEGTEITYTIPTGDSFDYWLRPLTDRKNNSFDGDVFIRNAAGGSNTMPVRIDYNK